MREKKIEFLQCVTCKKKYSVKDIEYTCPVCGQVKGTMDVKYNNKYIRKHLSKELLAKSTEFSHWRYLPLLPISQPEFIQPLKVGWSPLYNHKRINKLLNLNVLYIIINISYLRNS